MYRRDPRINVLKVQAFPLIFVNLCVLVASSFTFTPELGKLADRSTSAAVYVYQYHQDYTLPPADSKARKNLLKGRYLENGIYGNKVTIENTLVFSLTRAPHEKLFGNINRINSLSCLPRISFHIVYQLLDKPPPCAASFC